MPVELVVVEKLKAEDRTLLVEEADHGVLRRTEAAVELARLVLQASWKSLLVLDMVAVVDMVVLFDRMGKLDAVQTGPVSVRELLRTREQAGTLPKMQGSLASVVGHVVRSWAGEPPLNCKALQSQ